MSETAIFQIQQLISRSSDCVWRKDIENYGLCWSRTGEWRIMGTVSHGREAIKAAWWGFMDALETAWQVSNNIVLEIAGETANSRIFLDETLRLRDGKVHLSRGIYHDTYVIEDGRWVFGKRHFDLIYLGPPDMTGRFFPTIEYGLAPTDPDPARPATPTIAEAYG
jgi:hypothetical protein